MSTQAWDGGIGTLHVLIYVYCYLGSIYKPFGYQLWGPNVGINALNPSTVWVVNHLICIISVHKTRCSVTSPYPRNRQCQSPKQFSFYQKNYQHFHLYWVTAWTLYMYFQVFFNKQMLKLWIVSGSMVLVTLLKFVWRQKFT